MTVIYVEKPQVFNLNYKYEYHNIHPGFYLKRSVYLNNWGCKIKCLLNSFNRFYIKITPNKVRLYFFIFIIFF